MRTWYVYRGGAEGRNGGGLHVVSRPWQLALVEWFAHWIAWEWLYKVKMPRWPVREWAPDDPDEFSRCSPREWFGDVGSVVLMYVTSPLVNWVERHERYKFTQVSLGWTRVRELLPKEAEPLTYDKDDDDSEDVST